MRFTGFRTCISLAPVVKEATGGEFRGLGFTGFIELRGLGFIGFIGFRV